MKPMRDIIGPCKCQGCGQYVRGVIYTRRFFWLHPGDVLTCPAPKTTAARDAVRPYVVPS